MDRVKQGILRWTFRITEHARLLVAPLWAFILKLSQRIRDQHLQHMFVQSIPLLTASLLTGFIAVSYAKVFAMIEEFALHVFRWNAFVYLPVMLGATLIGYLLVRRFAPYARGSGIPQVMAAIELAVPGKTSSVNKLLNIRVMVIKILSSLFVVLGGGVVGREGPTIQISAAVFHLIDELLPKSWPRLSKKAVIMAGASAGLAAAFNTPLGGVVFAIEELTKLHINNFKSAVFTTVILSGLTAQAILGPYLYLGYPETKGLRLVVLLFVILTSILAGFASGAMTASIRRLQHWLQHVQRDYIRILYVLGGALSIWICLIFCGELAMVSGKNVISTTLFSDVNHVAWYVPLVRFFGPIVSFSSGVAGGVFAPSLSAGASIGSYIASLLALNKPETNMLILSGMVAFLSGVTRAPFTSAILVLEMTDNNNVIMHLMLAAMFGSSVARIVDRQSLYHYLKKNYEREVDRESVSYPSVQATEFVPAQT